MSSLGHQHDSEPATSEDKVMSKRHKAHRAEIEDMEKKFGKDHEKVLKKSIKYNQAHRDEHDKALAKAKKQIAKRMK